MMDQSIYYKKGFKYQLSRRATLQTNMRPKKDIHTRFITLFTTGVLIVEYGYAWDGPSGPMMDTKDLMRASLKHDVMYQLLRMGLLPESDREIADDEYVDDTKNDAKWKWFGKVRAWYSGLGLDVADGRAADPKALKKEYKAP